MLPKAENVFSRDITHSDRFRPYSATSAALACSINLGMLTCDGHSLAHILQLTHRSATARIAASRCPGSDTPAISLPGRSSSRRRLALARGVASSVRPARKIGHMRCGGPSARQAPQPLHAATCVESSSGCQSRSSRARMATWARRSALVLGGESAAAASPFDSTERTALRIGQAGRAGSGPTILPGLNKWRGSKIVFSSRKTGASRGNCFATHGVRESPVPCRALIVPPSDSAAE